MAKYKLLARAIIDDALRWPDYEFEYDGVPGSHMEPADGAARKAVEERDAESPGQQVGSPLGEYVHVLPPPLTPIVGLPANVDVPAVTVGAELLATAEVGNTLRCTTGNWTGEPTEYSYAWQSDGEPISATSANYIIPLGDVGHTLTCVVTATNAGGSTAAPPSNGVEVNEPAARRTTGGSHRG
jgi:hypothetical protein